MLEKALLKKLKKYIKLNYEKEEPKLFNSYGKMSFLNHIEFDECNILSSESYIYDLEKDLKNLDESFSDAVLRIIREKGLEDTEVYKKANLDRRLFSKIRNNDYKPSRQTAIALCMGLELNKEEAINLLSKAGIVLSKSSVFDTIILFFLNEGIHDISVIDEALLYFDQKTLSNY